MSLPAREDLAAIGEWIADRADVDTASAYVRRIITRCESLADFPDRGTPHPEYGPDVRSLSFAKHSILYRPGEAATTILRIIHGSRDIRGVWLE